MGIWWFDLCFFFLVLGLCYRFGEVYGKEGNCVCFVWSVDDGGRWEEGSFGKGLDSWKC